ncbi:MAG: aromatic amino acid hydroxylase [Polyangiaceae bacterium]
MQLPAERVPAHLRRFVVEQDYGQYNAVDQAVWRFVLLQTYSKLLETAHPAYREGLRQTGISVERIPSIAEMNERLDRFGWAAVCVDGFIPPRAFQEFQACGLLPIAADMRTREHLVYTPAPDIIHEAAGHAPILPDAGYSAYLRRIGELGRRAFTLPEEDRVFDAIHALSEIKEDPSATPAQLRAADAALEVALSAVKRASEAARLSRLYWWTAEYGLVGKVESYKIYGAGILSSLWESHACHYPSVRKLPLDEGCLDVSYDITRPQPQLFVVRDFDALHELLDRVERTSVEAQGGAVALSAALQSQELCSVWLSSGAHAAGVLLEVGPSLAAPGWLRFDGRLRVSADVASSEPAPELQGEAALLLTGKLADGRSPSQLSPTVDGHRLSLRYASGAVVEGRLQRAVLRVDGRLSHLLLDDVRVALPGQAPLDLPEFALFAADDVVTARAGAVDPSYYEQTEFARMRVPKPRVFSTRQQGLLDLYEAAAAAHRKGASAVRAEFPILHQAIELSFPDEWLLRWNMLESLLKLNTGSALERTLVDDLERLELYFERKEPIASGLRYLSRLAAA